MKSKVPQSEESMVFVIDDRGRDKVCVYCKELFFTNKFQQGKKYCSQQCKDNVWNEKQKAL
jgi:hypothetical protein